VASSGSHIKLGLGHSHGISRIHIWFVIADMYGFKIGSFFFKHAVFTVFEKKKNRWLI